jgi:PPOX class probable F420-dependent enzyme
MMAAMPTGPLPAELEEFVRPARPAIVAYLRADGAPMTVATWYLWLGDGRLLMSLEPGGYRARMLERDPRVALTVLGDDWYDHVSLRGRVVEFRPDPDWADLDRVSQHYRGVPYPRDADYEPCTVIVEVDAWHEFKSATRT